MQKQFPSSRNLEKFCEARQDLTIKKLAEKFLALKKKLKSQKHHSTHTVAVIKNTEHNRVKKILPHRLIKKKLLEVRKELLTGYQIPKSNIVHNQGDRL